MKEDIKTIAKRVYIAKDGKEFDSRINCINYEDEKRQENLEEEVDVKLGIETHANFPSMVNLSYGHEYKLFLIQNENDLDLFIKTYKYWFNGLEKYWEVSKVVFNYPDVLCILDFPKGGDEHRLYKITQLFHQYHAFCNELEVAITNKMDEVIKK